jgi:hypothetical protein
MTPGLKAEIRKKTVTKNKAKNEKKKDKKAKIAAANSM